MSFKTFDLANDVASIVSSINEVVFVSSSIYSNPLNVKFFQNIASASAFQGGYWETVYDSSPTSSMSTALMDFSFGYATGSLYNLPATSISSQNEKIKIYREMASLLLGDPDSLFTIDQVQYSEAFFILIKRAIQKDEIKKGATQLIAFQGLVGSTPLTMSDQGAVVNFQQTVGGDYAELLFNGTGSGYGQIWYNAGIIVLPPDLVFGAQSTWLSSSGGQQVGGGGQFTIAELPWGTSAVNLQQVEMSGAIDNLVDGLRLSLISVGFHNQTNLYSTVYFCRAQNTEFNYSSNPTFIDDNQRIVVTSGSNILQTRTYITTVGLYDANDNLLAAAKINFPITKSPDTESIMRIRLDY